MSEQGYSGGAATAGGMDFQHRVTAWVAVCILAEKGAAPPWGLPAGTTLERFCCEVDHPVDDLFVECSNGGRIFVQIKRSCNLSLSENSPLGSALKQFVKQFTTDRDNGSLNPKHDRFVLITSSRSSASVREHLLNILNRIRRLNADQQITEAAINEREQEILEKVLKYIRRLWKGQLDREPSEEELRNFLSLIYIQVLDVEDGGAREQESKNLLGSVILRNPDQADQAWRTLISMCAEYAKYRSGADRRALQRELLNAGFDLKALRSYEDDIRKLSSHSERTLDLLAPHARISVGSSEIKVRRACTEALRKAAEDGSLLVIGDPGAGKSGVLYDFVKALEEESRDYVFLSVDRLGAKSLGELRQELGLEHELSEVLRNWPGRKPAFLVIDALDAARANSADVAIRDLIHLTMKNCDRWRVIASIRKFDLRYDEKIKELFAGDPPAGFVDPEFKEVRHINIPGFSDEELRQIGSQFPQLRDIVSNVPRELRNFLSLPFNLRLVVDLVSRGVTQDELASVKTQIGLLDLYWKERVVGNDPQGDAREAVLREVCEEMVQSCTLRINRMSITRARTDTSEPLHDLLRNRILVEWQASPETQPDRYTLAFSHNILFDYAVSRLLFRQDAEEIIQLLSSRSDVVIFVYPSLDFHFRHLWNISTDRQKFWNHVFRIISSPDIPEISKVAGPAVAAELCRRMEDLEPFFKTLEGDELNSKDVAEDTLIHITSALLSSKDLVTSNTDLWCKLVERVSRDLSLKTAYAVRSLLVKLCDDPERLTSEQRKAAGLSARRLLEFAWTQLSRDPWLVGDAIRCVCWTFESDPSASASLIRRSLEREHIKEFGYEEMWYLASEIKRLIRFDPELVAEIYRAAFEHQEESEEPTKITASTIVPLISNRRQDYDMALHKLAEAFPDFLKSAPEEATRALVDILEHYVVQKHFFAPDEVQEEVFDFNGQQARICTDYSSTWDEGGLYDDEKPVKMLDDFQQFLEELATRQDREMLRTLIGILVSENRLAVVWRRLLLAGAKFPQVIGQEILPLAWSVPILTTPDTEVPVCKFLKAISPFLETDQYRKVEQSILSIPDEGFRNWILGCLSSEVEIADFRDLPKVWTEPYTEEEHFRDLGIPIDREPNQRIYRLMQPIEEFAQKHSKSVSALEEVDSILPTMQALYDSLKHTEGVHPKLKNDAIGVLAGACARVAQVGELSCEEEPAKFVKAVLLEASGHSEPAYDPQQDARFNEFPSWGSPAPRVEAARGLIILARNPDCATEDVLTAIEKLSTDQVPAVRYQIATHLNALYYTAPDLMWRIMERIAQQENNRGVLQGFLAYSISRLAKVESDRVAKLTKTIWDRITNGSGAGKVRAFCAGIFTYLYIWRGNSLSREVVQEIITYPATYPTEADSVLRQLRKALIHSPVSPPDFTADAIRRRALDLLKNLLRSIKSNLQGIENRYGETPFDGWSQEDQKIAKDLVRLIDHTGNVMLFASGAGRTGKGEQAQDVYEVSSESKRFYEKAGTILDELADTAIPHVTHNLLKILEHFIPIDPRGVFLRVHRVVMAGQKAGYQYESMAVDLIVHIVERYLAEYHAMLQRDEDCRKALVEVLDVFVKAGWPEARGLVYQLARVFR